MRTPLCATFSLCLLVACKSTSTPPIDAAVADGTGNDLATPDAPRQDVSSPPDAASGIDTSLADTLGIDTVSADTGSTDALSADTGSIDTVSIDTGSDVGSPDAGSPDAAAMDLPRVDATPPVDVAVAPMSTAVLTNRNDNGRTSVTLAETVLNTTTVAPGRFGLLFTRAVEGQIYAQPLYVPGVVIGGRARNVVYVATEHNMVYAFDADTPSESAPLWSVSLGTPVPISDLEVAGNCPNLTPEIGITSTPVIDPATGTIYVVAKTRDTRRGSTQFLHAIDITSGRERAGSPSLIAATVPGTGGGTAGGMIAFDAFQHLNRPGLALSNGVVYMAFASHCDHYPFHGWVIAYDAATLTLRAAFNTTPNGDNGGLWQSGTGLSVDEMGDVYFSAGDGTTTLDSTPMQLGQSVGRLRLTGSRFDVVDYFTPYDHVAMTAADNDLGSTGVMLMPGTRLALIGSKEGFLYVLNRDAMGHFRAGADSQIVQSFRATHTRETRNIHGGPVYWNSPTGPRVYLWGEDDVLKSFAFDGARFNPVPTVGSVRADSGMPGGILSVSAHNSDPGSGIVWVNIPRAGDANEAIVPGVLRAVDASDVSRELWNSDMDPRDQSGLFAKFCPPTIANGRVYLATFSNRLDVYGLR